MSDYIVEFLSKFVLVFVLAMSLGLSACGGGGGDDSAPQQTPTVTNPTFQSITGGGIKGPLANATVIVFAFDATQPGFKGAAVTTASTDASSAITGLNLPLPLNPAYIMEFSSVPGTTTDITTGTFPVITTLRTVITQALLNSGKDIYATPLTTLAVDIAVMNAVDTNGTSGIQVSEFEAALARASLKVLSTFGFGLDRSVDIFDTPPLINSATISIAEQANVAGYRSAVEAITAIAYQISQQSKTATVDTVLADLAVDLADNDMIDGSSGSSLNANTLQVLQQNPSSLPVPNTFPVKTIADVQTILAAETAITGATTATTNLLDGTIVTKTEPVRTSVDTDGDGVFNIDDDLPDNKDESVDSDGDGIGDKADSDDDNDGILDVDEGLTSIPTASDTDGDGIADTSDNCPNNFNPAQTNSDTDADGDACDLDDDGDGVDDVDDAFPVDGSKSVDTDSDGIDDSVDIDDDNDTVNDIDDTGLGLDGSTSCSLLTDCDDDGVLDGADADRTDPNIAINFAPITNNDAVTVNEDAVAFLIDVTANDIDDIVNLSAVGLNDTNLGAVAISANSIEYTPVVNANGVDTFTYTVTDGNFSSQGQVTVTIVAVNDTPVATDDTVITSEDVAVVTGDVTANDVDVDGDVLTATLLANASKGNVVDNGNGTFRYTPNANFNGSDSFTYTVSDANGGIVTSSVVPSTIGTVTIIVNPVNNNPFAKNDNASVNEEQSVNINLAANDTDIDSALDLTSIVINLSPSNGTLVLNVNGTVDYTHDGSETIADSFTYTIKDSSGAVSNVASVMLMVNPLNDAPVANNDSASVNKGQSVNINLAANDTDAEGAVDIGSIVILTAPANGTYVVNTNGTVDYTHDGSVTVTDVFTYTIQDTSGAISNVANVALNVSTLSVGAIANALVDENSIYTGVTPVITGTPIGAVTYALSGIDAADFTLNAATGVVSMVARDFELPADADTNNVYVLTITATDTNNNTASQSWTVTVQDILEVSAFSLAAIANVNLDENSAYTSVIPALSGDAPIGAVFYTLGGTDATLFTINSSSGVVSMVARDFELPVDANADNIYDLSITATDTDGNTAGASWSVTVADVIETATFTINTIANASVNESSVYTSVIPAITGTPVGVVSYALSGADAADFTINISTGVVSMVARDFELPVDADVNNVYALALTATDADGNTVSEVWNVTVVDVIETATFTINRIAKANVNENSVYTSVVPAITGTPIGAVSYTLGGADATLFTIISSSGVVSMVARDFELPVDANANNVYALAIIATDADGNAASEAWNVTVVDVTETATFTINTIANANVNENSVYTSVAPAITGTPIGAVTYTLSGIDAADFTINASTGVVSMVARDFELPVDTNTDNIYDLVITAMDVDGNTASEAWNVTVIDVTETTTFTINTIANASVNENSVYTSVVPAITGTPIGVVSYDLSGIDAADFTINASMGVVSMVVRDFESPADADTNNVYAITITATDADGNAASEAWNVTVVDVTETATFTINTIANASVNENSVYTSVVPAITGTPIGVVSYTLSGTDAADFMINAVTGVVSMAARDFELPVDANTNNVYALTITATDTNNNTASQSWTVSVQDVVEVAALSLAAIANVNLNENSVYTSVIPALSGDAPIGAVTYSLAGTDAADFSINAATGVVSMVARDFELPIDANTDNIYDLSITATDADGNTASEAWNVTVTDVIETATFTINTIANASVNENSGYTGAPPTITGAPIGAVTYSLAGTDAADFSINAATGVVSMVARDFELPVDADANNVYVLAITATDADGNTASEAWNVTVTDVIETAAFTINTIANASVNENSGYTGAPPTITGTPIGAVTYTLAGTDAADFTINATTGVVSMVARDFELPVDADANNVYVLAITATDADGNTASEAWNVTVTDVIETAAFTINTIANASVNENSGYTGAPPTITGTPIGAVTYTLAGTDAADFTINATTGVVSMVARDFELPVDADANNVYVLAITATDADGNTASEAWNVTVTDVIETAAFTINTIANASVNENSGYTGAPPTITGTPIGAVTYTLAGTDAADFTINATTGVVSMVARDFELPVDADVNNVYVLAITATDADGNTASEAWNVTVTDVIETATFTINTIANASVNENSVYTGVIPMITGTPIGPVTYTLAGTDAADFTINASTGAVSMAARDFELPIDANTDNIYGLSITATDADGNTAGASWSVTVADVIETATFTINMIANASVNENSVYTSVVPAITGTPIGVVTYALSGVDAADFTINTSTGLVSMIARDFELPVDADVNNVYALTITATDANNNTATQSWTVSVQDAVEISVFSLAAIANVNLNENSVYTSVTPVLTGNVPIGAVTYTLAGSDAADFTINASTGVVSMVARDFESPADANTDNIYDLSISAIDEDSNSASQSWAVSVQNVVELLAVDDIATVNEGQSVNINLAANDVADNVLNLSSIFIASPPSNAALMVNSNGTVDYIHDGSETITDFFTYTIRDTSGTVSNISTVSITIIPVNNIPVANDDNVTTIVDTTVVVSNVLANDTDGDGDVLNLVLPTPTTLPANGSVIYNGSGTFTYTPVAGFLGTDSFTYTVTDSIASAVGTVIITVTPPGAPIDIVTLMSSVEGGVAGIENAEANVYAYWTDNYKPVSTVFVPEDKVYNHLSGVFDTVVNTGDLLLNGSQWVSEGEITGIDDGNGGLDLIVHDLNNVNVEVASFKLTARYQDLSFLPIINHLNTVWRGAMRLQNERFSAGAKLITDYRFEALTESHILMHDNSCQKDGTTKLTDLNGNCNSVDAAVNITGYAKLLSEVVAGTAWVDPNNDFSTPPGAVIIATNDVSNKSLLVQLVSGGLANYYEVHWDNTNALSYVSNAVAGTGWVQNAGSGVEMIHFQVPASFIKQYTDDLSHGLNYFLTVQNGYVRQGLKHVAGAVDFSDGHFNGNALNDILANFTATTIPGLVELTGTWVDSVASANGDSALIHIFANGNYESSGSCDLDGSTGMEYGTVLSSGSTTNIIATALVSAQGLCGPAQGNKTLAVNGDVLTVSELGFPDVVYNRLLGTLNPVVGSWLHGDIQNPGEAHTILTFLDDTRFTLSQDCTTDLATGFEYGTYVWDQGNTNNLTGVLSIDSNSSCGLHDNAALTISGFTVTVVGDTLTLTDSVGGGGVFIFTRVSPAYVVPMLQMFYTLDNLMMDNGEQITGSFTWTYVEGDFEGGSGQFTDLTIPGYGTDIAGLTITFDVPVGIEITLTINTNNNGVTINLDFVQPLSLTQPAPIDLTTSAYEMEIGARSGLFVSGTISLQVAP